MNHIYSFPFSQKTFFFHQKRWLILLLCGGLTACDLIEYHPYECDAEGISNHNASAITQIETNCAQKDTIRFITTGDTQRHYDESVDLVNAINSQSNIDFVIHGGDMTDFGLSKEFIWMYDILNKIRIPWVAIIGNHDCLGNGYMMFKKMFGSENFVFTANFLQIVCLNTNAIEYDYSTPIPDFDFIETQLNSAKAKNLSTIVSMHAPPLSEQFNNNAAKPFEYYLTSFPKLLFCTHAHDHNTKVTDIFNDGVLYYGSPSVEKRQFCLFTITAKGYSYETISF